LIPALGVAIAMLLAPAEALASPRTWQPLVIRGAQIRQLLGARVQNLEVVAAHAGQLQPIPFQLDERLPDGRYALPNGQQPVADDNPGFLDRDDELVMMISDLGERTPASDPAMRAGAIELEVIDPLGGQNQYAYAAAVERPRLSSRNYVEFDPRRNVIETDGFRIGFTNQMPTDFALQKRMRENRPNMMDRFKIRASTKVFHYFDLRITEDRIVNRLVAWRDGPVRVIRRIDHAMRLLMGVRSPEVVSYNLFYRDFIQNPFEVRFPWIPRLLFGDISLRIALDFTDLDGYSLVWSGMDGKPRDIRDTKGIVVGRDGQAPEVKWIAFRGNGRIVIQTLAPSPVVDRIERRLYFRNDPNYRDPPERVPGENPAIGYVMTGWEDLPSGTHQLDSLLIDAPEDYSPDLLLHELSMAPKIECRAASVAGREVSATARPQP